MPVYHRTQRLQIYGGRPEVSQLFNGRYEMVVRCQAKHDTEAWYNDNKSQIFADFGTLYSAEMAIDGISARDGEAYANMVLVRNEAGYTPTGDYVVTFVYQTLTNSFVQETADKVDYELNGLRRVTRSVIAKDGASYGKTVGTSTLSHNEHGYGSVTLTLARAEEDSKRANEGGYVRIVETWLEPGQLRLRKSFDLEGLETLTYEFIGAEGTTEGRVIDRDISNFEGFQTFVVRTVRQIGGTTVVDEQVAETFETYAPFTYPGVANAVEVTISQSFLRKIYDVELDQPVTADIIATVEIRYQDNNNVGTLPHTFWSPKTWAKVTSYWLKANLQPTSKYQSLNGYRAGEGNSKTYTGGFSSVSFLGQSVKATIPDASATINISGGPEDPVDNTYVIARPRVEHAFTELKSDGTTQKWYKRTVVYATIPAQT